METLFLFGSGASSSPKVGEITEAVLTAGNDFSTGAWDSCPEKFRDNPAYSDEARWLVSYAAALVRSELGEDSVNYEHMAHVLRTLMTARPAKPASMMLARKVSDALDVRFPRRETQLVSLMACSAMERLKWIVYDALRKNDSEQTADVDLNEFVAKILPSGGNRLRIVTLNHDLHLELALSKAGVTEVNSGFVAVNPAEPPVFSPDRLTENSPCKLLKLHGSIDWFSNGPNHCRQTMDPEFQEDVPVLLSGTYDKLEQYAYFIYPWLWAEFQNQLRVARRIVVVGYGFRDEAVNARLREWLGIYGSQARLMVIDPRSKEAVNRFLPTQRLRGQIDQVTGALEQIVSNGAALDQIRGFVR